MKRREFKTLLGTGLMPLAARAQVSTILPLIAFLSVVVKERNLRMIDASPRGLQQLGFIGRDFEFAYQARSSRNDGRERFGVAGWLRRNPEKVADGTELMRSEPGSWRGP